MGDGKQWHVTSPKEYEQDGVTRTKWVTVGRAFEGRKGIKLRLDALPINFNGELFLFEVDRPGRADRIGDGNEVPPPPSSDNNDVPF